MFPACTANSEVAEDSLESCTAAVLWREVYAAVRVGSTESRSCFKGISYRTGHDCEEA